MRASTDFNLIYIILPSLTCVFLSDDKTRGGSVDYLLYSLGFGNIYWFAFFNFPFQFLQFALKLGSLISMVVISLSPQPLSVLESEKT